MQRLRSHTLLSKCVTAVQKSFPVASWDISIRLMHPSESRRKKLVIRVLFDYSFLAIVIGTYFCHMLFFGLLYSREVCDFGCSPGLERPLMIQIRCVYGDIQNVHCWMGSRNGVGNPWSTKFWLCNNMLQALKVFVYFHHKSSPLQVLQPQTITNCSCES